MKPFKPVCALFASNENERGQIAVITAIFAPVAAMMAALAIDTGAISAQKRELQGLADMAAIAAASNLKAPEKAAWLVLSDNGYGEMAPGQGEDQDRPTSGVTAKVETGHYTSDPAIAHDARFQPGATPYNAARVSLASPPRRYFDFIGTSRSSLDVWGTAVISAEASLSVGSRLASLDDGLLNTLLGDLTGARVSLSAMSYDALLEADIDLFDCLAWLADDLALSGVTYDDILKADIPLSALLEAMSETVTGQPLAAQSLRLMAQTGSGSLLVDLDRLIDLGKAGRLRPGQNPPAAVTNLKALNMLMAGAMLANGGKQVELDLAADLPGLVSLTASLDIGERPQGTAWFSLEGPHRAKVSTSQLVLNIEAGVGGGGLLSHADIRLPLHIDLASAEAAVTDIECVPGEAVPRRIRVDARPSVARVRLADIEGTGSSKSYGPARLVRTRLLKVSAFADVDVANPDAEQLSFLRHEIGGVAKTVETQQALTGTVSSVLTTLDYDIELAGLSLGTGSLIRSHLAALLGDLAGPLDSVVFNLTSSLGLGLGEADIWVHHGRCNPPALVQ